MHVELLVVPDCPHRDRAAALLRDVLDAAGLADVKFRTVTVDTEETAATLGFWGSPTFSIDGQDVFPEESYQPAIACRLYPTDQGVGALPSREELLAAIRGHIGEARLAAAQRAHWDQTYGSHLGMYGEHPSEAARYAMRLFRSAGARTVVDLGGGHGRDALFFARCGLSTRVVDFSATALRQLSATASAEGLSGRVQVIEHDVRNRLPISTGSVDAVFAHMLLCMALSTSTIRAAVNDVRRVLRPGGLFVYTVRHTGDADYRRGISRGDDIYEQGGFAVHFFSRELVDELANGWRLEEVHELSEGTLPRRLFCVTMERP